VAVRSAPLPLSAWRVEDARNALIRGEVTELATPVKITRGLFCAFPREQPALSGIVERALFGLDRGDRDERQRRAEPRSSKAMR
jgi:hypothetical protein